MHLDHLPLHELRQFRLDQDLGAGGENLVGRRQIETGSDGTDQRALQDRDDVPAEKDRMSDRLTNSAEPPLPASPWLSPLPIVAPAWLAPPDFSCPFAQSRSAASRLRKHGQSR